MPTKREEKNCMYRGATHPPFVAQLVMSIEETIVVFRVSMSNVLSARRDIKFFEFRLTGTVIYGKTLLRRRRKSDCGENGVRRRQSEEGA